MEPGDLQEPDVELEILIKLDELTELTRGMLAAMRTIRAIMVTYAALSVAGAIVLLWVFIRAGQALS